VPVPRQERGGHRRIDAARHGYDNTHSLDPESSVAESLVASRPSPVETND
jgi:hypothetical protein